MSSPPAVMIMPSPAIASVVTLQSFRLEFIKDVQKVICGYDAMSQFCRLAVDAGPGVRCIAKARQIPAEPTTDSDC